MKIAFALAFVGILTGNSLFFAWALLYAGFEGGK